MNEYFVTPISDHTPILQNVLLACFHAFLFSLPINTPNILCFTNLLSEGIRRGVLSYFTLAFSQTVFIGMILYGSYNIVQAWYDIEPFLFLFGSILTFQIICTAFNHFDSGITASSTATASTLGTYKQKDASESSSVLHSPIVGGGGATGVASIGLKGMSSLTQILSSFSPNKSVSASNFRGQLLFIFLLQLCNPVCLFQPSRYITSFDITETVMNPFYLGATPEKHINAIGGIYLFCFFIAMWIFSTLIGLQISFFCNAKPIATTSTSDSMVPYTESKSSRWLFRGKIFPPLSSIIALFLSTLLFAAMSKYTWRLFMQYPSDLIGTTFNMDALKRELPARDSGIRRRFIDNPSIGRPRRIPIEEFSEALQVMREEKSSKSEKINIYFDEESKRSREQIIVRFKSHFINRFISKINEARVFIRTPFAHNKSIEQIEFLKEWQSVNGSGSKVSETKINQGNPEYQWFTEVPHTQGESQLDSATASGATANNKKKGKTKYGYLTLQRKS